MERYFPVLEYLIHFTSAKVEVNGASAHPLFKHLKSHSDGNELNWNFNKYLVVDGNVVKHYYVDVSPSDIEADIRKYFEEELR